MKIAGPWLGIWKEESGQALMLGAICMTLLMAVMALAVDVGYMHFRQVQLQTAADSAAIAAGLEIGNCSGSGGVVCDNMKTAAEQSLIEDGITSATITPATNQCTVSNSTGWPCCPGCLVQVTVSYNFNFLPIQHLSALSLSAMSEGVILQ